MSMIDPAKVHGIVFSPINSQDATTPEAILAREAKKIQSQAEVDTKYDPIVERYSDFYQEPILPSVPLLGAAVAFGLLALSLLFKRV
jgi:hypothetical protein